MSQSRWKCPDCGSGNVEISLLSWYRETTDGNLVHVSADYESEPHSWICQDCAADGEGSPIFNDQEAA